MTSSARPWTAKWKHIRNLSGGGQGITSIVESRDGAQGVLKRLKDESKPKNRSRMYKEVASLKAVYAEGGLVPRILDGNVESFEDTSISLYFVMEEIKGKTLKELVSEKVRLSFQDSLTVARSLLHTIRSASSVDVGHRDMKPDNIIVESLDKDAIYILDFGLSFNQEDHDTLTDTTEIVGNRFFIQPNIGRDLRADLSGIVAVFYYCLTGNSPGFPVDDKGKKPHQRVGMGLDVIKDAPDIRRLELFFSTGFTNLLEHGPQSADELENRLIRLSSLDQEADDNPGRIDRLMEGVEQRFSQFHRPSQIDVFNDWGLQVNKRLQEVVNSIMKKVKRPYVCEYRDLGKDGKLPQEINFLRKFAFSIKIHNDNEISQRFVIYYVGYRRNEIVVLRGIGEAPANINLASFSAEELEEVHCFEGSVGAHAYLELSTEGLHSIVGNFLEQLEADAIG